MNKFAQNDDILTRMPPQALDAEVAVLSSLLQSSEALSTAVELLDETSFYKDAHKKIFMAAFVLFEKLEPVDVLTMKDELEKRGHLEAVGGPLYLAELVEKVPAVANIEYHCKIVSDKAMLRKLIHVSNELQQACFEAGQDAVDIIDTAEQKIFALSESNARKDYTHISSVLHKTIEKVEEYSKVQGKVTGVATGFHRLDDILSGLQNSDMIILAARPSMGKTALALNMALNAAKTGIGVAVFSLEMADYQLVMRLLAAESKIDSHRMRLGKLKDDEWARLGERVGVLADCPIYIDDTAGISVLELRSKARRLKAEHDIGLVVVDYLQLMRTSTRVESRQIEISMISQALKNLAKELDVPVLALSQLSRAVESRGGDGKPMLSDLRESGAIEQDADVVMFINRPAAYGREVEPELQNKAEVIVAKQRNGPTGEVDLVFLNEFVQFANAEEYHEEVPVLNDDPF